MSEQRLTHVTYSRALLEVFNNHKYLWDDAGTKTTLPITPAYDSGPGPG